MKRFIAITAVLVALLSPVWSVRSMAQVGTWKAFPAYNEIEQIADGGSILYVLSQGDLYSCNTEDGSVTTYDKTRTLSDSDIKHIAWSEAAKRLIIVYANQNIDFMDEQETVVNLSDYYSKSIANDKTVYHIYIDGIYAYLSTGFGIVKVNMKNMEISDTYTLGFKVNWTHTDKQYIYAESASDGKYRAELNSNLLNKSSWTRQSGWTPLDNSLDETLKAKVEQYKVDGPKYNHFYGMEMNDGKLYTVGGLYNRGNAEMSYPGDIQIYDGTDWTILGGDLESVVGHKIVDQNCIAVDPLDKTHFFVCGKTGLYEFKDNAFVDHFNCDNSPLYSLFPNSDGKYNYVVCNGLKFDKEGNLWIINNGHIIKFSKDREWETVLTDFFGTRGLTNLFIDSRGLLWFGFYHWEKLGLYNYNPQTKKLTTYSKFVNEDGANVTAYIDAIAEDRNGNIWIGTGGGPLYLSKESIEEGDDTFIQVKVPRNDGTNLADYLLAGIQISAIAIDGANRKWFGTTANGIYVISDDCYVQEYNFTQKDSELISDQILSIMINHTTGDVYIATDKGLCSYKSNAIEEAEQLDGSNVYAYPNPVTPEYTGSINITGLTYNASVKIVSASGSLVAEGTSNGGMFTWDGCDLDGKRVASGVYMVMAATEDGKKGCVCKVAIVR